MHQDFMQKGWCKVVYRLKFTQLIQRMQDELAQFFKLKLCGMLDIVRYFNEIGDDDVQLLAAHIDPGFYSDAPGLQLFHERSDKWIDIESDIGYGVI